MIKSISSFLKSPYKEHLLITCDFSQLEICVLAELSGDPVLIKELNDGVDIHTENASLLAGVPKKLVTPEMRTKAKTFTFQLQYGSGAVNIAKVMDIPVLEAKDAIGRFYEKYKGVRDYHNKLSKYAAPTPITASPDSVSLEPHVSGNFFHRSYSMKKYPTKYYPASVTCSRTELLNYPIQGTATGDLVPFVVSEIKHRLGVLAKLLSTVHDDFTLSTSPSNLMVCLSTIEAVFLTLPEMIKEVFDYDLKVLYNYSIKLGTTFGDGEKYTRSEIQSLLKEDNICR